MKNLKAILFVALIVFAANQNMQAQNKAKETRQDVKVIKSEVSNSAEAMAIEQKMQRAMESATPEQRVKYEAKMEAYRKGTGNVNAENSTANKNAELKKAYADTKVTQEMLEESSIQIKNAQEKLNQAKKSGTLTADEIQLKEAKIITAEKELKEARVALDSKKAIIMRKHNELPNN